MVPGRAGHFLPLLPEAVILLVLMRSPMYFCRNLLLLLSLSCSSWTTSIRWTMVSSESCSALACLRLPVSHERDASQPLPSEGCCPGAASPTYRLSSSFASRLITSRSSLVRRGLMARASFGSRRVSTGPTAAESRGTMRVPLLLRFGNHGRADEALVDSSPEEDEDDSDRAIEGAFWDRSSSMAQGYGDDAVWCERV